MKNVENYIQTLFSPRKVFKFAPRLKKIKQNDDIRKSSI